MKSIIKQLTLLKGVGVPVVPTFKRIGIVGDSTTWGYGAGGSIGANNGHKLGWPSVLSGLIRGGNNQNWFGNGAVNTTMYYPGFDDRINPGVWAVGSASSISLGSHAFKSIGAGAAFAFTPSIAVDTFIVHYEVFATGGVANYNIDGGATLGTITMTGSNARGRLKIQVAKGTHTLNLNWQSGGQVTVNGLEAYDSTIDQVMLLNFGYSASKIADNIVATSPWSPLNMLAGLQADELWLDMTINDANAGTADATYRASLETWIAAALAAVGSYAKIKMITGNQADATVAPLAQQDSYVASFKAVAAGHGIVVSDIYTEFGTYVAANARGDMFDTTHPIGQGYARIAAQIKTDFALT